MTHPGILPGILVVEDDVAAAKYMEAALADGFREVRTAGSATEALLALEAAVPGLVFLDLRLPDMYGLDLLTLLKQRWAEVPVILVTASGDVATVVEAVQRGAINFLVKPVAPAALLAAARRALDTRATGAAQTHAALPEIVGVSSDMVRVRHLAILAARSDVNVLMSGETGVGKELVARAIHRLSGLAGGPFIGHNCATTTPEMFDSEFFGHVRGAFTGADRDHVGLLVRANGSVLMLDELESMGPAQQARLLRVMDDGEVRPVGASWVQSVSVRFLAATNRDPARMLEDGTLREDLYYRLRGLEIRIPPLRSHREDVPALAAHFLGASAHRLASEALDVLCRFSWPGNVRQLRNVLRGAEASAAGGPIGMAHLALGLSEGPGPAFDLPAEGPPAAGGTLPMKALERHAILKALRDERGNRSRAAVALGIDRSTLRRKMKEYGVGPEA